MRYLRLLRRIIRYTIIGAGALYALLVIAIILAPNNPRYLEWYLFPHNWQVDLLFSAITKGNYRTVDLLITFNKSLVSSEDYYWQEPIFEAVRSHRYDIVTLLIRHGANPNVTYRHRSSPLSCSVDLGDQFMAETLLVNGADPNYNYSLWHQTPLLIAAQKGSLPMIKLLVQHGANVNAKDMCECSPLDYARKYKHKDVEKYLRSLSVNH